MNVNARLVCGVVFILGVLTLVSAFTFKHDEAAVGIVIGALSTMAANAFAADTELGG